MKNVTSIAQSGKINSQKEVKQKAKRSSKQTAELVELTIFGINQKLNEYLCKQKEAGIKKPIPMPSAMFQKLVVETCNTNKVSESFVRTIAGWKKNS